MSRLTEIIDHKRHEIEPWLGHTENWRQRAKALPPFRGFKKALISDGFGFVAEVKRASPSAGVIVEDFDPVQIALGYDVAGADCISVLTDEKYFHGHLDYLALIRHRVQKPLLRKDFMLHEVQIYQAALAGADAILLIVAALDDTELLYLLNSAKDCSIDCLVEVHNEKELERALVVGASFIGINNRNLATFEVDLATTEKLAPLIPKDITVVSESGIRSAEDIRRIVATGVHAALVGEILMRAEDPRAIFQSFVAAAKG
jgi:indole-3-glycerol phosphate synthase